MIKNILICLFVLLCLNCAPRQKLEYTIVTAPNGYPAAYLTCHRRPQECFRRAGEICPYGYSIFRISENNYDENILVQCYAPRKY